MEPNEELAVTDLLRSWSEGDREVAEVWLDVLYQELRRLAAYFLAEERPGHTLQPTALVHEAYFRLEKQRGFHWKSRGHFMMIAARLMRRILVDHARGLQRKKRGGELVRVDLTDVVLSSDPGAEVLKLHEAIECLKELDQRKASVLELHFFAGLSVKETAEALECSEATVTRDWRLAKAWLARELT